jgi:hypothetical protein
MRRFLYLLTTLFVISCTKKEIKDIQADSFRISILPVANTAFNQYQLNGTLDVRQATGSIEYGLVVGKSLDPTIDRDKVFKTGSSSTSVDFTQIVSNLDTGSVYYVRAYGKSSTGSQYSANQLISKLSPKLLLTSTVLQYGQLFNVVTNFNGVNSGATPTVRLNGNPVTLTASAANGTQPVSFSFIPSDALPPGEYTLSVDIGGITVTYPGKLTLLEGKWSQLDLLPRDYSSFLVPDRYVTGDWIYTSQAVGNFVPSFTRYNYRTGETQALKPLSKELVTQGSAIVQIGKDLHFLGGELIATGSSNRPVSKSYRIYHTATDTWSQEPDIPGGGRRNGAIMLVGNYLYYGLGWDPSLTVNGYFSGLTDFWVCDLNTKTWKQLPDFQGKSQFSRSYFIVNGKLYVTAGSVLSTAMNETWCYDPAVNQWSRKADYPGQGSTNVLAFGIGAYGYAGIGETSTYNSYSGRNLFSNFYKYNTTTDNWTEVSNFGGNVIQPFVGNLGSTILVGAGLDRYSAPSRYLFEFKP